MRGYNKAIILGRLGKDPELKELGGQPHCQFSVATSEKYKDKETTEWHTITVWGLQATNCAKYLKKGSSVLVTGSIHTRSYEKDGTKHYRTEIKAEQIQFMDSKPKDTVSTVDSQESSDIPF